uniref:Uncharacterized protein n=1 Tax=Molossus molossus TaxID=27622 RepID=A0A7J8GRR4_MOLMO|nr:hypothetical protein HJG59_011372 [Molossus molossus]
MEGKDGRWRTGRRCCAGEGGVLLLGEGLWPAEDPCPHSVTGTSRSPSLCPCCEARRGPDSSRLLLDSSTVTGTSQREGQLQWPELPGHLAASPATHVGVTLPWIMVIWGLRRGIEGKCPPREDRQRTTWGSS